MENNNLAKQIAKTIKEIDKLILSTGSLISNQKLNTEKKNLRNLLFNLGYSLIDNYKVVKF